MTPLNLVAVGMMDLVSVSVEVSILVEIPSQVIVPLIPQSPTEWIRYIDARRVFKGTYQS